MRDKIFNISDFIFNKQSKKELAKVSEVVDILNKLTIEQKEAVEFFGNQRYQEGRDDEFELNHQMY